MDKNLKVTKATAWRKKTELVEMPSGNVAELQRMNILAMVAKHDNVPNFLLKSVAQNLNGVRKTKVLTEKVDESKQASEMIEAVLWMAKHVFVYPKLVDGEPQNDDEVCISDIGLEDLMFVAGYATGDMGAIEAAQRFHAEQNGHVEPIPASADVEPETS